MATVDSAADAYKKALIGDRGTISSGSSLSFHLLYRNRNKRGILGNYSHCLRIFLGYQFP